MIISTASENDLEKLKKYQEMIYSSVFANRILKVTDSFTIQPISTVLSPKMVDEKIFNEMAEKVSSFGDFI